MNYKNTIVNNSLRYINNTRYFRELPYNIN